MQESLEARVGAEATTTKSPRVGTCGRGLARRSVRRPPAHWFRLNRREFKRQFSLPAVELKEIVALDDIELLPERSSIKIRSHRLHGPLPEIIIHVDPGDRLGTFDRLGREVTKLCVISRLRRELVDALSGASFLPATTLDSRCVPGLQWHGRTVLPEAADFIDAYHWLWRKAVSEEIFPGDRIWPDI